MKRRLVLAGIILLAGGVLYEERHRAETFRRHIVAPELTYPELQVQSLATNGLFSDNINLWDNPRATTGDVDLTHASAAFQADLTPAGLEKLQPGLDSKPEPALTVLDKEVIYALFANKGFTLTLSLKPAYSNPQALIPSHLDAGIGGSISF